MDTISYFPFPFFLLVMHLQLQDVIHLCILLGTYFLIRRLSGPWQTTLALPEATYVPAATADSLQGITLPLGWGQPYHNVALPSLEPMFLAHHDVACRNLLSPKVLVTWMRQVKFLVAPVSVPTCRNQLDVAFGACGAAH
jgi:hypothetical protein